MKTATFIDKIKGRRNRMSDKRGNNQYGAVSKAKSD